MKHLPHQSQSRARRRPVLPTEREAPMCRGRSPVGHYPIGRLFLIRLDAEHGDNRSRTEPPGPPPLSAVSLCSKY